MNIITLENNNAPIPKGHRRVKIWYQEMFDALPSCPVAIDFTHEEIDEIVLRYSNTFQLTSVNYLKYFDDAENRWKHVKWRD